MKLVCGVGINDSDYVVNVISNGKHYYCPIYLKWKSMISRCYNLKYKLTKPSYDGCTVTDEWLTFSNFSKWMLSQNWKGKHLDKDILFKGNKVYSSFNCCFVSQSINNLLCCPSPRGKKKLLTGVFKDVKSNFRSMVSINGNNKSLGSFNTEIQAHIAWRKAKSQLIIEAAFTQTQDNVREALLERARVLLEDYNPETTEVSA